MTRFYGHFAAAYGTFWFAVFLLVLLTPSSINLGALEMFGLPILAAIYAGIRVTSTRDPKEEIAELRAHLALLDEPPPPPPPPRA
jgi:hypothetical protein